MVLNRKHFDDVDELTEFGDKVDGSCGADTDEGRSQNPAAWRRILIEKATNNVRKAFEAKTDLSAPYKLGELVFDEEANKFGRVERSSPGILTLALLSGGKSERRDEIPLDFVRKNRIHMTLPQMASELFLSEIEVIALLNEVENEDDRRLAKKAAAAAPRKTKKPAAKKSPVVKSAISTSTKTNINKVRSKPSIKIAAKKSSVVATAAKKRKPEIPVTFAQLIPKGATTDPIVDPNGYIQQNFLLMNNKELAVATGLSEHTIRRKMGEWGLKRKDFVKKA